MNTRAIGIVLILLALWLGLRGGSVFAPPPFKAEKFCVLIVEETTARNQYTAGQRDAIMATGPGSLRDYVAKKNGELRIVDKDQAAMPNEAAWVREAFAAKGDKLPWIVAATPSRGLSQELPPDDSVPLVKTIAGE